MHAVKAKFSNGQVELPAGLQEHEPCEVTVLFPDEGEASRDAGREAFLRAAGAWRHMDTEKLKRDIYAARKISTRRVPEL